MTSITQPRTDTKPRIVASTKLRADTKLRAAARKMPISGRKSRENPSTKPRIVIRNLVLLEKGLFMKSNAIASTLQSLLNRENITAKELSKATGISPTTLYSMLGKTTNQADLEKLKILADYFGENVSIFCGIEDYEKPIELSDQERILLSSYRGMTKLGKERLLAYIDDIKDNPKYVTSGKVKA